MEINLSVEFKLWRCESCGRCRYEEVGYHGACPKCFRDELNRIRSERDSALRGLANLRGRLRRLKGDAV